MSLDIWSVVGKLRDFELIAVQCRRLLSCEVGQRLVVIDDGSQLMALRRGKIALKIEDEARRAKADF